MAASLTGGGVRRMPCPGRSGCVITRAISWPASCRALREGTANSAVPTKTTFRKSLTRGGHRRGAGLLLVGLQLVDAAQGVEVRQPVDEQDAVEVVDLVLERASGEAGRLDAHFLPAPVAPFHDHRLVARNLADPARIAQTALVADLDAVALDDLRVGQRPDLVLIALHDADAQRHADLRRGETGARRREHGLREVVHQALDGRVDARDPLRLLAK